MYFSFRLVCALLASQLVLSATPAKRTYDTHHYYVLEHIPHGASLVEIAHALGVEVVEQAGELRDHWLIRSEKSLSDISARSEIEDRVMARYEDLRTIAARDHLFSRSEETRNARAIVDSIKFFERQVLRQRAKRAPPPIRPPPDNEDDEDDDYDTSARGVAERLGIQDPMFPQQWHIVNDEFPEHMMNVTGIWEMGLTGKGVISSLVDDGLDYTSEDLKENFDAEDSYNFNDHEPLPTPKLFDDHHGTRCAGQIAAGKNNACGIGIAYESKVAGVRILSGPISDVDEAAALNYGFQNVSIYSCSWGPPDNGMSMEGPSILINKAVLNGINNGRQGKGSIFVFASGNGASHGDQCNFDGYTNSIYSVTVSAVDHKGMHPYYSEPCAANLIVAYSSGGGNYIVTTDRGKNNCATTHGGTSAAAPNAAAVIALALEARPDLTWRDVQHLLVNTAQKINPDDPDWEQTHAGRPYSYKYGFGILDGYTFVKAALDWQLVKNQSWFLTEPVQINKGSMNGKKEFSGGSPIVPGGVSSTLEITPQMLMDNNFEGLEHIDVRVWIRHGRRGDVEVELVSPNGVRSVLGAKRPSDRATTGYPGWKFMTVKHWGESPLGTWTLKVSDQNSPDVNGTFIGWDMKFWGSSIDPKKTILFEFEQPENAFPPTIHPNPAVASTTKSYGKPTLPTDHGHAPGENSIPAFPVGTATTTGKPADNVVVTGTSTPSSTSHPTADEGYFSDLSNLVSSQKWFFGVITVVALFGAGAGIFFWRRRVARLRRAEYSSLGQGEGGEMIALAGRPPASRGARELYDAFGEQSDDEADEETRLRPRGNSAHPGIGFHSGFLDDDEATAGLQTGAPTQYKDEPDKPSSRVPSRTPSRAPSPGGSAAGSGDSWEHASRS